MYGIKNLFLCKLKKRDPNSVAHQMTGVKGQQQGQAVAPTQAQQSLLEPQLLCSSPPCRPQGAHLLPPAGAVVSRLQGSFCLADLLICVPVRSEKEGEGQRLPHSQTFPFNPGKSTFSGAPTYISWGRTESGGLA